MSHRQCVIQFNFKTDNLRDTCRTDLKELDHLGTICIAIKYLKASQLTYVIQHIFFKISNIGSLQPISAKVA